MEKPFKYKAFISYAHRDKKTAKWVHKRIENYKIPKSLREKYPNLPKDLKRSIFRDEEELPISGDLPENLTYALKNSEFLIVICSPNAVSSTWVDKEIIEFKSYHGEKNVLPYINEGEAHAKNPKFEAFPKALRYKVDAFGELTDEESEPIAGNAQSFFDKEHELVKLIAGVLKVAFADLWEREKRERFWRRVRAGVIVSVILVLGWYFVFNTTVTSTNLELENFQKNKITIEHKLRHETLSEDERMKLYKPKLLVKKK